VNALWPKQVAFAVLFVVFNTLAGGVTLWWITGGDFTLWETLYFTVITVSTVGYGEPTELKQYEGAHLVIALLIISGLASVAFFNSTLTAVFVEGTLGKAFRRRQMDRRLTSVHGHIIVAGCGRTGMFCVEELHATQQPFVIIDTDEASLERLNEEQYQGELLYVVGDATDDHALQAAGVERARGLVAALTEDSQNAFVVLSARALNPHLHIVAKSLATENEPKLRKAGADKLVSPHKMGGYRLVAEMLRPGTVEFLDQVHVMSEIDLHMEDVKICAGSELVGRTLRESRIRERTTALIIAIREESGGLVHTPDADYVLTQGSHLIVVGNQRSMTALKRMADSA
jgi:voltage-gated potassium channel